MSSCLALEWGRDEGSVLVLAAKSHSPDASVKSCGRLGETDTRRERREAGAPPSLANPGHLPRPPLKSRVSADRGTHEGQDDWMPAPRRGRWGALLPWLLTVVLKEGFPGSGVKRRAGLASTLF